MFEIKQLNKKWDKLAKKKHMIFIYSLDSIYSIIASTGQ